MRGSVKDYAFLHAWASPLILLIIHTHGPCHRSRPAGGLLATVLAFASITVILPFSPLNHMLGVAPLPLAVVLIPWLITMPYVAAPEPAKRIVYRRVHLSAASSHSPDTVAELGAFWYC